MGAGAASQAWMNSRATNGPLLVLMAIAFEADEKGECVMSVAELARKARLSDRAVQNATPALVALGELEVDARVADAGRNRYRLTLPDHGRTGEESAPVKNLHPEESAPVQTGHSEKPQVRTGEKSAPVDNFSDALKGSVVSGRRSRSREAPAPSRDDVERLCEHLASRIEANGSKRPVIGKKWRDAARRMLDIDGRTEDQVRAAIDWCQQNEFWHRNILSMPKLREQYDRLRLDWKAEQRKKAQPSPRGNPDDEYAAAMQRIKARKENANGTRGDGHDSAPRQVSLPPAAD